MFCYNCGNQLGDTDLFCANCGTPVKKKESEQIIQPINETAEQPKKKSGWIVAILSIVAVIVLILLFVLIQISGKKVQNTFEKYRVENGTDSEEKNFNKYFGEYESGEDYSF